jgi:AcrR family transcriptional regulator
MLANANSKIDPPPKARLSSPERRAAIVDSAMALFARKGFRGTTTREIASAVGVSEPVLYQHFATKRDLYTAIVDHMVAEASREFESAVKQYDESPDPEEYFNWLGGVVLDWYTRRSDHVRLLFFSALEGHELAELWHEKATKSFLLLVEGAISARQAQGQLRAMDARIAARAFVGMVAHYGLTTTMFQMALPEEVAKGALKQFVELFLGGLRPTKPEGIYE